LVIVSLESRRTCIHTPVPPKRKQPDKMKHIHFLLPHGSHTSWEGLEPSTKNVFTQKILQAGKQHLSIKLRSIPEHILNLNGNFYPRYRFLNAYMEGDE
jgi:hypothetical protein